MEREIKFRVWDSKAGHFWKDGNSGEDGYDWNEDWLCITLDGKIAIFDTEPYGGESKEQDRFIIQQYTGLKDKNGKEIYEGDVVKDLSGNRLGNQEVCISEDFRGWNPFLFQDAAGEFWWRTNECEVIGNIYKNSELVKLTTK